MDTNFPEPYKNFIRSATTPHNCIESHQFPRDFLEAAYQLHIILAGRSKKNISILNIL